MRRISDKIREIISRDSFYRTCSRKAVFNDHVCKGRITMEHALIFAGRQMDMVQAIIPLCAYSHGVDEFQDSGILNKEKNEYIALSRMSEKQIQDISKAIDYSQRLRYLRERYKKSPL